MLKNLYNCLETYDLFCSQSHKNKHTHFELETYPESVLHFDVAAVEDGGLQIMRDGEDLCDIYAGRRRDGLTHLFKEVFSTESSFPICKEAVLSVHTVLGLDLA